MTADKTQSNRRTWAEMLATLSDHELAQRAREAEDWVDASPRIPLHPERVRDLLIHVESSTSILNRRIAAFASALLVLVTLAAFTWRPQWGGSDATARLTTAEAALAVVEGAPKERLLVAAVNLRTRVLGAVKMYRRLRDDALLSEQADRALDLLRDVIAGTAPDHFVATTDTLLDLGRTVQDPDITGAHRREALSEVTRRMAFALWAIVRSEEADDPVAADTRASTLRQIGDALRDAR